MPTFVGLELSKPTALINQEHSPEVAFRGDGLHSLVELTHPDSTSNLRDPVSTTPCPCHNVLSSLHPVVLQKVLSQKRVRW